MFQQPTNPVDSIRDAHIERGQSIYNYLNRWESSDEKSVFIRILFPNTEVNKKSNEKIGICQEFLEEIHYKLIGSYLSM